MRQNALAAEAPPRTPLGELHPDPLVGFGEGNREIRMERVREELNGRGRKGVTDGRRV